MSTLIFIRSGGVAGSGGGSDATPAAVNWDNITVTSTASGYESNFASQQTIIAIDRQITLKAAWTSTSSNPAKGQWFKNGVAVQSLAVTPVTVDVSVNDKLYFAMSVAHTYPNGNYDTGTVTVTNESDGGASLDTFTFAVQYVFSGAGGADPILSAPRGGDPDGN